jgi:hypothetical protein
MLIKGKNLTQAQRDQVLGAFPFRLTQENGYRETDPCGASEAPITDAEWVVAHAFYFAEDGSRLSNDRAYCELAFMAD